MLLFKKILVFVCVALLLILNGILLIHLRRMVYLPKIKVHEVHETTSLKRVKLWFMEDTYRTLNLGDLAIFPGEDPTSDRIINQFMYVPPGYDRNLSLNDYKRIFVTPGSDTWWHLTLDEKTFSSCPVRTCTFVDDPKAEFVLNRVQKFEKLHESQILILYNCESPQHSFSVGHIMDLVISYRSDSDLAFPYGQFIYFDEEVRRKEPPRNFASGKKKLVAWLVSNCHSVMNNRMEVARELQKHVEVDIYGKCGDKKFPNTTDTSDRKELLRILSQDYKFYLAFENSNCREYITEKFWFNALQNDMVPIVYGESKEAYTKVAPENSFIHIEDFPSMRELGAYLKLLDANDTLYNEFFAWKGTGKIVNQAEPVASFWCRLCGLLNSPKLQDRSKYALFNKTYAEWWNETSDCDKPLYSLK